MARNFLSFLIVQILCFSCALPALSTELALGKSAKVKGAVDIPVMQPIELNFKPVSEVMLLRRREVAKHGNFLESNYIPNRSVYGRMVDRRPWWGLIGLARYGRGDKSITGPSIQSLLLLNPYILVGDVRVLGMPSELTEADLKRTYYRTHFEPTGLRLTPDKNIGEISYDVSGLQRRLCQAFDYSEYPINNDTDKLELINARDLGFNYYYIPPNYAKNLQLVSIMGGPKLIPDFIHCGNSCGYPGGCNNRSPANNFVEMNITKLPAQVSVMLWKAAPKTGREPPDMTFTVHYH